MRRSAPTWLLGAVVAALAACASPTGSPWADGAWQEPQDPQPTQEPSEQKASPSAQEKAKWVPPVPDAKDFDWIQLTSGEWLKGEIMSLRRRTLEFDSVEMNRLTIDWGDVKMLRSPRINSIIYKNRETARGTLLIRDDLVIIGGPEGETRFPRSEIYSIVSDDDRELSHWDGKVTFGLASQSGNISQVTINTPRRKNSSSSGCLLASATPVRSSSATTEACGPATRTDPRVTPNADTAPSSNSSSATTSRQD